MPTWKSKICRGMDVVECIMFTRQDTTSTGRIITATAAHVPSEQKPREEWTTEMIDVIGETIAPTLDLELSRIEALEAKNTVLEADIQQLKQ